MDAISTRLAPLLSRLNGRAAGAWRVEAGRLTQLGFEPAPDLAVEVAQAFADATRSVNLDRLDLGIVRAAVDRQVAVSIASELPPDMGSGRWLRAFGADRSVAVPIERDGAVALVVSVALGRDPEDAIVVAAIRDAFSG